MMPRWRARQELKEEYRQFIGAPYSVARHYVQAKNVWKQHHAQALRGLNGDWKAFYNFQQAVIGGGIVEGKIIQSTLRDHLVLLQKNRCCYCKRWLQNIAYARPIEHILPKDIYPQFTFHYRNLAVACHDCNQEKGATNWSSVNTTSRHYPKPLNYTDHFHPRLHNYDAHIRYVRYESNNVTISVYAGQTAEGRKLCSDLLIKISKREALYNNNRLLSEAINKLHTFGISGKLGQKPAFEKFLSSLHTSITAVTR